MSYILDALRRSQAERERGQVPGLDAPTTAPPSTAARGMRSGPWLWLGAGLALGALGAALVWLWRPAAPPPMLAAAAPVGASAARPVPTPSTPTANPAPPPVLPVVVSAPPQAAAPAVLTPQAVPQPAPAAPTAPPRALSLAELPPEQRRELPPLVLGGSIWSENAVSRFVIVNGQVVREGEVAAPGVTVERIAPKAVVLRWRELRLELPL